jgi:hypothetical protein
VHLEFVGRLCQPWVKSALRGTADVMVKGCEDVMRVIEEVSMAMGSLGPGPQTWKGWALMMLMDIGGWRRRGVDRAMSSTCFADLGSSMRVLIDIAGALAMIGAMAASRAWVQDIKDAMIVLCACIRVGKEGSDKIQSGERIMVRLHFIFFQRRRVLH